MQKASKSGREKVGLTTVEVFLQMCCLSTSIFERPRLFLCLQHAPITKPIYTQNSEEPVFSGKISSGARTTGDNPVADPRGKPFDLTHNLFGNVVRVAGWNVSICI